MSTATTVMTYVDTRREGLAGSFVVVAELRFGSAAMAPFCGTCRRGPVDGKRRPSTRTPRKSDSEAAALVLAGAAIMTANRPAI
jgi:hypothetical protein